MYLIERKEGFNNKICTAHDELCADTCVQEGGGMLRGICKDLVKTFVLFLLLKVHFSSS